MPNRLLLQYVLLLDQAMHKYGTAAVGLIKGTRFIFKPFFRVTSPLIIAEVASIEKHLTQNAGLHLPSHLTTCPETCR